MEDKIDILNNIIEIMQKQLEDKDKIIEAKDKKIDELRGIICKINSLSKI